MHERIACHRSSGRAVCRRGTVVRYAGVLLWRAGNDAVENLTVHQSHACRNAACSPVVDALNAPAHGLKVQPFGKCRWPAKRVNEVTVGHPAIKHCVYIVRQQVA